MRYCNDCGSLMLTSKEGYKCINCGKIDSLNKIEFKINKENRAESVYLVKDNSNALKVNRQCPSCGHNEAYRRVAVIRGEHAGVKSDRNLERFKCTKCGHSWIAT